MEKEINKTPADAGNSVDPITASVSAAINDSSKKPATDNMPGQEQILGKPVYWHNAGPLNEHSGFVHKLLCDGLTITAGTSCAYRCQYCYVESQVSKLPAVRTILSDSHRAFDEVVIRRNNVLPNLARDLTRKRKKHDALPDAETLLGPEPIRQHGLTGDVSLAGRVPKFWGPDWQDKVIFGSPLVDIAPTPALAEETVECCDLLLRLTDCHIRLLSKSPLLATVIATELAQRFPDAQTGAKARVIFGLSTGTLDDKIAAAIELHVPSPSKRLEALRWLQENGFRTYAMLCPILPQAGQAAYAEYAKTAMEAIRADRCEHVWAEVVNFRAAGTGGGGNSEVQRQRDSFQATHTALVKAGFSPAAELFDLVARDPGAWDSYSRMTFEALAEATPAGKLRFLQYPRNFVSIDRYWYHQRDRGAILLGAAMTNYLKKQSRLATAAAETEEIQKEDQQG